jgi:hypothetical protein
MAHKAMIGTARDPDQRISMFTRPISLLIRPMACSVACSVRSQAVKTPENHVDDDSLRLLFKL